MKKFLLFVGYLTRYALAVDQTLCSSDNTGAFSQVYELDYMSNGWCSDNCRSLGDFNYAIVQGRDCWCSNNGPSSQLSLSECQNDCPGYPIEKCGGSGTFGYIQLRDIDSSATQSPSSSGSGSSSSSSRSLLGSDFGSATPSTSASSSPSSSSSPTSTSSRSSSSSASRSGSSSSSSTSIQPITSIVYSIMTITGSQQTQFTTTQVVSTIISLPSSTSSSDSNDQNRSTETNKGFFDSPGKVAGTFTAVGVVVAILLATFLYFCCIKNRHHSDDSDDEDQDSDLENAHSPNSYNEHLEKFGIVEPVLSETDTTHKGSLTKSTTPGGGPGAPSVSGANPDTELGDGDFDFVEVDQRLDPNQLLHFQNGSRASLGDDMDYSRRVLRVTNL